MNELNDLNFQHFAVGLYQKGHKLMNPDEDDFSIIAGCLILIVGLEKLIKEVLVKHNPLMVLEKVQFDDILDLHQGRSLIERRSVGLDKAFNRLICIYPKLKCYKTIINKLVSNRNFFAHSAGIFKLKDIEGTVRVSVTEVTEIICYECLNIKPETLFGKDVWDDMIAYKEAYEEAEILDLNKRIAFLKRIYQEDKMLPCKKVSFSKHSEIINHSCPICNHEAQIEIGIDIDYDYHERIVVGAYPYLLNFYCETCGFSISESKEIETLIGKDTFYEIMYNITRTPDY